MEGVLSKRVLFNLEKKLQRPMPGRCWEVDVYSQTYQHIVRYEAGDLLGFMDVFETLRESSMFRTETVEADCPCVLLGLPLPSFMEAFEHS